MKSRLSASLIPILTFALLFFVFLGSASALPYSEGTSPFFGNGMVANFNQNQEWHLPFWGELPFTATDLGRWPVTWNHITFGGILPAFPNFDPETFRHSGWINDLAWRRIDEPGGNAPTPVPEPATLLLLGIGLLGFTGIYRKQSQG